MHLLGGIGEKRILDLCYTKAKLQYLHCIKTKNINIILTEALVDYLVEVGYDPKMGARPLQRVIDKEIKRPLARELLFGNLKQGGKLTIDLVDKEISLKTESNTVSEKL